MNTHEGKHLRNPENWVFRERSVALRKANRGTNR